MNQNKEPFQMTVVDVNFEFTKFAIEEVLQDDRKKTFVTMDDVDFPEYINEGFNSQSSLENLMNCSCREERIDKCNYEIKNLKDEIIAYKEEMKTVSYNRRCDIEIWISERLESLAVYEYYLYWVKPSETQDVVFDGVKYNSKWIDAHDCQEEIKIIADCCDEEQRKEKCSEIQGGKYAELEDLYEKIKVLKKEIKNKEVKLQCYSHYLDAKNKICGEFCSEIVKPDGWWRDYIENSNVGEHIKVSWKSKYLTPEWLSGKVKCNFCEGSRTTDIISEPVIIDGITIPYYLLNSPKAQDRLTRIKELATKEERITYCMNIIKAFHTLNNDKVDSIDFSFADEACVWYDNKQFDSVCRYYLHKINKL